MTRSHATEVAGLARSAAGKAVEDLERLDLLMTDSPSAPGTPARPSPKLVLRDPGACVISGVLGREGFDLAVVETWADASSSATPSNVYFPSRTRLGQGAAMTPR